MQLYTGDALTIMPTIPADTVQLILTSPPYNVGWDYGEDGYKDKISVDDYTTFIFNFVARSYALLRDGGVLALNLPASVSTKDERNYPIAALALSMMRFAGFKLREEIVWVKSRPGVAAYATSTGIGNYRNPYLRHCHERVLIGSKGAMQIPDRPSRWPGGSEEWGGYLELCKDVWQIAPGRAKRGQPLVFPRELVQRLVYLYSNPGDTVLDPFMGSGRTLEVAAEMERTAAGIEITPRLVEEFRERYPDDASGSDEVRSGAPLPAVALV